MNIDERLEALAQSVEFLAPMQRDNERRAREERAQTEQLFGQVALRLQEASATVRGLTGTVRELADSVDTLARIAGVHQDRLDGHEQRLKDLEGTRT